MMIKRVMMLAAWAFVACCPSMANSFIYRGSVKSSHNTNSMLARQQVGQAGKTIGAPSGKTIERAGVGRSSGGVAIDEKVRIPRVPSALDPEGVTRRVDSPLHILGKGEDGEVMPDEHDYFPVVREGATLPINEDTQQKQLMIQQDHAAEGGKLGFERRLPHHGSRPQGLYPGSGVGDGICSFCDTEHTPSEAVAKSSEVKNHHGRHSLENPKGSSELPSRVIDARPLHKRVESIQDDNNSAPTNGGLNPAVTRIVREAVSDGQGYERKKAGRSYPHEGTARSFFSLHLQDFDDTEGFNQGPSPTLPYFPAEIPHPPVQPGATSAAAAAAGHGTSSRSTPPPPTTDSAAEATAEEDADYVYMLTAALHDAWGRGAIRGTSLLSARDIEDGPAARPSSAWWPCDEAVVESDDLPQVFHDAWCKRGIRDTNTLFVGGTTPVEGFSSTLSERERQAKTNDDNAREAATTSYPPKNGRVRRWLARVRRGWANRRSSRPRRRRDHLTW
ncbi:unnamed protein product [Ectocarpus fasciculatus]